MHRILCITVPLCTNWPDLNQAQCSECNYRGPRLQPGCWGTNPVIARSTREVTTQKAQTYRLVENTIMLHKINRLRSSFLPCFVVVHSDWRANSAESDHPTIKTRTMSNLMKRKHPFCRLIATIWYRLIYTRVGFNVMLTRVGHLCS